MKKIDFKTRAQWGYFKSAILGLAIGILIAPGVKDILNEYENTNDSDKKSVIEKAEDAVSYIMDSFSVGSKVKVIINGNVVAIAGSEEAGKEAVKNARLTYNADGVKPIWVEIEYEPVDKESEADKELLKKMKTSKGEELEKTVIACFDNSVSNGKKLAYTMRIDDYTVTVEHFEDIVSVLEDAQSAYDDNNEFQVGLKAPASKNVAMYEVEVTKKLEDGERVMPDKHENGEQTGDGEPEDNTGGESSEINKIPVFSKVALTEGSADDGGSEGAAAEDGEDVGSDTEEGSAEAGSDAGEGSVDDNAGDGSEDDNDPAVAEAFAKLSVDDGIKYVGFTDRISVVETYVNASQIESKDAVYSDITTPVDETGIYVVVPGDCLSIIAEKVGMTEDKLKELNEGIEDDDDIYYDDRLNIIVPTPPVEVMVEKQETYTENYYADVEYQDDGSMFIGETSVIQEGSPGKHTVTDLVTYKGNIESDRKHVDEIVEVAAVPQIVLRGTKSRPTYMFPVTNWNVTSNFGYRWGRLHAGTDVGVPEGTTVRASRGGQVVTAGWVGGYGNCVIIDHGDGVCTRYGHLSQVLVSVGQYVDQGEQIALSGNTGRSTGPHLHFEIRINGEPTDPLPYLYQTQ